MCLATEHLWKANPHVCPPADLMAAIKLQAQPRGFSLGAFGMTVWRGWHCPGLRGALPDLDPTGLQQALLGRFLFYL